MTKISREEKSDRKVTKGKKAVFRKNVSKERTNHVTSWTQQVRAKKPKEVKREEKAQIGTESPTDELNVATGVEDQNLQQKKNRKGYF